MQERILTPEQVAHILQVHQFTVLKFIKQGKLKASKLGRVYRIKESDIELFLEESSNASSKTKNSNDRPRNKNTKTKSSTPIKDGLHESEQTKQTQPQQPEQSDQPQSTSLQSETNKEPTEQGSPISTKQPDTVLEVIEDRSSEQRADGEDVYYILR